MENNQSLNQESSAEKISMNNPESIESAKPDRKLTFKQNAVADLLLRLVAYYPWFPLTALLLVFFGSGTLALYSLGYVGRDQKDTTESTDQPVEIVQPIPPASSAEKTDAIPTWMVFAIALSCAGGCILILRLIRRANHPQATAKSINRYQVRMAQRQRVRQVKKTVVPRESPHLHHRSFVVPQSTYLTKPYQPQINSNPIQLKSLTKAIPPVQTQSSNRQGESLADSLDLRKQSPLSSILRRY